MQSLLSTYSSAAGIGNQLVQFDSFDLHSFFIAQAFFGEEVGQVNGKVSVGALKRNGKAKSCNEAGAKRFVVVERGMNTDPARPYLLAHLVSLLFGEGSPNFRLRSVSSRQNDWH